MFKLVIFDLDGTLADTSEGILNSHRHTHIAMGRPIPPDHLLFDVIGAPLLETYRTVFQFSDEEAVSAVRIYRSWYEEHGIHQAKLYPGINRLLFQLREHGILSEIATLKAEQFAESMMNELGVRPLLHMIYGMDGADTLTKAGLIQKCLSSTGFSPTEACMIGDSIHDYNGAQQCNVPFIGVSYGFGFHQEDGLSFPLCRNPIEIAKELKL